MPTAANAAPDAASPPPHPPHPLTPLSADELRTAAAVCRDAVAADAPFAVLRWSEPTHDELAAFAADGTLPARRAFAVLVTGPDEVTEVLVDVGARAASSVEVVPGATPYLLISELLFAMAAVRQHPDWTAAMARRGIEGEALDRVQIDPWPPGTFDLDVERGRRLSRVIFYLRSDTEDNGYARPIEGVMAHVDLATAEVLEIVDTGVVPVPEARHSYYPEHQGPLRDDLRPIHVTQPDGPSFSVEGNLVHWQRWQVRVSMDQVEGLVLHDLAYADPARGGEPRPVLHRAALSEMVVPYGHTSPSQRWKNAFDAGEWGLGRMVNSLTLGCDCLGEIHYFDAVLPDEQGRPQVVENAICMHEEDFSILWKHQDLHSFRTEVRRQRRLVISSIYTVGNYEYAFYWYFYLDGTIQLEVKLTGIIQPMAVPPGAGPADIGNANLVAPQVAAPHHQHLFCVRLDMAVDGHTNTVTEVDVEPDPPGPDNPEHNGFHTVATVLRRESEAKRVIDPSRSRTWRISNPEATNGLGLPTAYKLLPVASPTLHARPESWVARRAGFATANLWVTRYDPDELYAAGRYPSQSTGGDGLPAFVAQDRTIEGTDIVVWHTFGVTHLVRPEDFPVMPVEMTGFTLVPYGFFDRNPAMDVPPTDAHGTGSHCHTDDAPTCH
ncbi:MAG: primary-amine oxidase [Acidimicrobiales bacterium]|nr:primary-amine oxidase [Acidimicrobiales bacterium]